MNSVGVEGIVVSVIEAVLPDVERPRVLLQLLQLLDDRRPHLLRDNSTHRLTDPAQLNLQLKDVGASLTPVKDGLKLLGGPQAGLHTDLGAVVHQGTERLVHHDLEEGHRQECRGDPLDEVDPVLLRPPLHDVPISGPVQPAAQGNAARSGYERNRP